ncbi:hypothetical protein LSCM1_03377 [Leishmania martiniquensis]|uniref:Translin-associated factor X-interacting protein 1 N-terminal domain-containing protein n=1 Tax=Leishmania martiniquensis TaxID=1580590 RepID=A0A836KIB2_9TRYP|nr:hypothetical protein LSCM1_03377 [Leishmania martiniquensis]
MLDHSESIHASENNGRVPQKAGGALSRGRRQRRSQNAPFMGLGVYHLAPLDRAFTTVAAPHSPALTQTTSCPLVLPSAPPSHQLVSSGAVSGPLRMWPAVASSRQRRRQAALQSRAPFALQLEAFVRREHQQYLREHPTCSRADCLHIFREVFSTFVNHFSEYKGILSIIRDEYDAALDEMSEKVKQMQVKYLESQTDRELHATELIQLKESMNATISNQKAQLSAAQGLLHALRDQISAAEHANALMTMEMEQQRETHIEAQQQVKLLSHALVEESARTAAAREATRKVEKVSQLQEARIAVLKENVAELEDSLRRQTYVQLEGRQLLTEACVTKVDRFGLPPQVDSLLREGGDTAAMTYSKHFVTQLLARIDALQMKVGESETEATAAPAGEAPPLRDVASRPAFPSNLASGDTVVCASLAAQSSADTVLPALREWLRQEGVGEAEVEPTNVIVPPGRNPSEAMGFLCATVPVKHRHLSLQVTLQLMESFWRARAHARDGPRLPQLFLEWLQTRAGNLSEAKALGVNLLDTCQHNIHHPDCRVLLAVLRGFLPEDLVYMCRNRLAQLRRSTSTSAATLHGKMAFDAFFAAVREVCPEKSLANMLHLRFTIHCRTRTGEVELDEVLSEDAYFVRLFKQQWVQEVEGFTLRVVEGIRDEGDEKRNSVSLTKATRVLQRLDAALGSEVYTYISLACQRPVIDVSSAEGVEVPLDAMLFRFRTSVLLYRRSPEDVMDP